jgi:hypothetical protein
MNKVEYFFNNNADTVELRKRTLNIFRNKVKGEEDKLVYSVPRKFVKKTFSNERGGVIKAQYPGFDCVYFVGSELFSGIRSAALTVSHGLGKTAKERKQIIKELL